jgi:hypothetical protein
MINKRLHVIVDELTPEMEKVSRRIFENPVFSKTMDFLLN